MKKLIYMLLVCFFVITACGPTSSNENMFKVMIISEIPVNFQESFVPYIEEILDGSGLEYGELDITVELFPVSHDKLTIEIVNRNVDVFVVDESLRNILLDPYGLYPLDDLKGNIPEDIIYDDLVMEDDRTGEEHLYAVPFTNESTLVEDMGLILPSNMLGAVTSTSVHQEIGVYLLSEFQ